MSKSKPSRTQRVYRNNRHVLLIGLLLLPILAVSGFLTTLPVRSADASDPVGQERLTSADDTPATLLLSADAIVLPADDGSALITAIVRDATGQPVAGAEVHFQSERGGLSPVSAASGFNGVATSTFTAGAAPGQAVITAQVGSLTQAVVLQINAPQDDETANMLLLEFSADDLKPGQQTSVTATLVNASGQPIAGALLTLFGSLGEISPASDLSDVDGRVTATFSAGNVPGQARISVLAGYVSASDTLHIEAPATAKPGDHLIYLPLVLK